MSLSQSNPHILLVGTVRGEIMNCSNICMLWGSDGPVAVCKGSNRVLSLVGSSSAPHVTARAVNWLIQTNTWNMFFCLISHLFFMPHLFLV